MKTQTQWKQDKNSTKNKNKIFLGMDKWSEKNLPNRLNKGFSPKNSLKFI